MVAERQVFARTNCSVDGGAKPVPHEGGTPPREKHTNADALSRLDGGPNSCEFRLGFNIEDLPCGGCHYCRRAHLNWAAFVNEVDNVIPLTTKSPSRRAVGEEITLQIPHSHMTLDFAGHLRRTSEEENPREAPQELATLPECCV